MTDGQETHTKTGRGGVCRLAWMEHMKLLSFTDGEAFRSSWKGAAGSVRCARPGSDADAGGDAGALLRSPAGGASVPEAWRHVHACGGAGRDGRRFVMIWHGN